MPGPDLSAHAIQILIPGCPRPPPSRGDGWRPLSVQRHRRAARTPSGNPRQKQGHARHVTSCQASVRLHRPSTSAETVRVSLLLTIERVDLTFPLSRLSSPPPVRHSITSPPVSRSSAFCLLPHLSSAVVKQNTPGKKTRQRAAEVRNPSSLTIHSPPPLLPRGIRFKRGISCFLHSLESKRNLVNLSGLCQPRSRRD